MSDEVQTTEDAKKTEDVKKYLSFIVMLLVAAAAVLIVGEICKFILPDGTVFDSSIFEIYLLAGGLLLLIAGLNKLNLENLRNLTAFFVGLIALDVVLYFLDKLLSSSLWGAVYPSVMDRIPPQYFGMYYNALTWFSVILAAAGLFLLFIRSLDLLKDTLSGTKKA